MKKQLFVAVLGLAAGAAFAAEPVTPVPAALQAVQVSETIDRAERAVNGFVSAWATGDAERLGRFVTEDAVVDFALDEPGTYLTVEANSLLSDCTGCKAGEGSNTRISNLRVYPTSDKNAVFVHYLTTSDSKGSEQTQNQLALVELRGDRIAHVRNFAAAPVYVVAKAQQPKFIRPADRAPEIALR